MKVWHKILSLFLIPTLLWAGMGFSLSRHYCLGMLVDEAWYYVSESCERHSDFELKTESCRENIEESLTCCSDSWLSVAALSIQSSSQKELSSKCISTSHYLKPNSGAIINTPYAASEIDFLKKSSPPLTEGTDILIQYQRLLI